MSLEEAEFDETGDRVCSAYFLIDETGEAIPLPEKMLAVPYERAYPYGIPLNHWYCRDDGKICFHGAKAGHRIDAITERISFAARQEAGTRLQQSDFIRFL